jgi:hypothetical protein
MMLRACAAARDCVFPSPTNDDHWTLRVYLAEWVRMLVCILVPLSIAELLPIRDRDLSIWDASIQESFIEDDTLPILQVATISFFGPLLFFAIYPYLFHRYNKFIGLSTHTFSWCYFSWWTSCMVQTVGTTIVVSEWVRRTVQMPRPDCLSRCFTHGMPTRIRLHALAHGGKFHSTLCVYDDRSIYESGFQSLPSEHTVRGTHVTCCGGSVGLYGPHLLTARLRVALVLSHSY